MVDAVGKSGRSMPLLRDGVLGGLSKGTSSPFDRLVLPSTSGKFVCLGRDDSIIELGGILVRNFEKKKNNRN